MKNFMLFAGSNYYPMGGIDDLQGVFETIEEAKTEVSHAFEWAHIYSISEDKIILKWLPNFNSTKMEWKK